jgi:hypothetical protein
MQAEPIEDTVLAVDAPFETKVQWVAGGATASLLRVLGTLQLDAIVRFVDQVRATIIAEGRLADFSQLREWFHHEAHAWLMTEYRLRLLSSLDDPHHHDRVFTVLWATNGALRPTLSDALLLRTSAGASAITIAALHAATPEDVAARLRRAGRRVNAFGLEIQPPASFGAEARFRTAIVRLESLIDRARRIGGLNAPTTRCLIDLLGLVRTRLPKVPAAQRHAS